MLTSRWLFVPDPPVLISAANIAFNYIFAFLHHIFYRYHNYTANGNIFHLRMCLIVVQSHIIRSEFIEVFYLSDSARNPAPDMVLF